MFDFPMQAELPVYTFAWGWVGEWQPLSDQCPLSLLLLVPFSFSKYMASAGIGVSVLGTP